MSHCSKKILVSRNELRETENIGATDLDELIANFLLQVREFLFLIISNALEVKVNANARSQRFFRYNANLTSG